MVERNNPYSQAIVELSISNTEGVCKYNPSIKFTKLKYPLDKRRECTKEEIDDRYIPLKIPSISSKDLFLVN